MITRSQINEAPCGPVVFLGSPLGSKDKKRMNMKMTNARRSLIICLLAFSCILPVSNAIAQDAAFVAITWDASATAYSMDGINWSASPGGLPISDYWCLAYGDGMFLAIANGDTEAAYSADGINWTGTNFGGLFSCCDWTVAYGDGLFVAITPGGTDEVYSADGFNWTTEGMPSVGCYGWGSLAYGNGTFVAIGDCGT
jgi:hypothetical protein